MSFYSGKGVLRVFHSAYIQPQATSRHLHNNNQVNLPIFRYEADQLI